MSWKGEKTRHSLSSKGIKTAYNYKAKGKPKLSIRLPKYTREKIELLNKAADDGRKEWIAELAIINDNIFIDDVRISDKIDHSELNWNTGDDDRDIGYIHYHPPGVIPEFSATDFALAIQMHNLRINRDKYPYTIMGMTYPCNGGFRIKLYGVKSRKNRLKDFEELEAVESDMRDTIEAMTKSGELVKMEECR